VRVKCEAGANLAVMPPPDIQPSMEPAGLALFEQCLAGTSAYLEYGCGGSTLLAMHKGVAQIFSVDTDRTWIDKLLQAGAQSASRSVVQLVHCNVGPVGDWGMPVDRSGMERFPAYAPSPWAAAAKAGAQPDLVLVDGRFRVAACLYSFAAAKAGTRILFDDYVNRRAYHVVEEFLMPVAVAGRMAMFQAGGALDVPRLMRRFAQFSVVPL
jgi:hypothetical protein